MSYKGPTSSPSNPSPQKAAAFLRWAGSKRQLLGELVAASPSFYNRYFEPFVGSGCLFFALQPPKAVISDLNPELIHTYRMTKNHPKDVHEALEKIPKSKEAYYEIRALEPTKLTKEYRAARFIYLNRFCFNGLYRTNLRGAFNVPYGAGKSGAIPTLERLLVNSKILKRASIKSCDFEIALADVEEGDFVYLDPPYCEDERRIFREYCPGSFSTLDLERLISVLKEIHRKKAFFLLSYNASPYLINKLKRWKIRSVQTTRNISGFAGSRKKVEEILIWNY